jgi:ComF family protein
MDYWLNNPLQGDVLVPVPLHPRKLRERGYNQAALLAHELGKTVNLEMVDNCLTRIKYTSPQARSNSVVERRSNVNQSFICRDQRLKNRQVILIDDVSTSGATLDACATVLKSAGALSVWGLVLAREI